jgi:hypothetical protein
MVHMLSLRSRLPYGGKVYREGQHFEAEERHAVLLVAVGVARVETVAERNHRNMYASDQPKAKVTPPRNKRKMREQMPGPAYDRRDLALLTKDIA